MAGTRIVAGARAPAHPLATFWAMPLSEVERTIATSTPPSTRDARAVRRASILARPLGRLRILARQLASPITMILIVAAILAAATGDPVDSLVILAIIALSAGLGAWQEGRAATAVAALLARVAVTVRVERDGVACEVPTDEVVPGDRLILGVGDIVPADCLLLESDGVSVDESSLTGESFPVSKAAGGPLAASTPLGARSTTLFNGTSLASGKSVALAVLTGADSTFGHIVSALETSATTTSFEAGIQRFGGLLLRVMFVLVAAILLINMVLQRPLVDSVLFALALAVGITPQMLPVIVSVSLAAGARLMARNQVIVKRLDAIEDLGAMSVLCTDKTGTITEGRISLELALDPDGSDSARVLELAALNSGLQSGYRNAIDDAVLARHPLPAGATLLDEVPYDFSRKRLSVATRVDSTPALITKGSLESVLDRSTLIEVGGVVHPIGDRREGILGHFRRLSADGHRVLGIAWRPLTTAETGVDLAPAVESELVFLGFLAFSDPIKVDARASIDELERLGVDVKIVTGDNRFVAAAAAAQLGFSTGRVVVGAEVAAAGNADLHELVMANSMFAEVEPAQKQLILRALRDAGESVGFLGDGINDAIALHGADVGISVDTAASVAKKAADVVLLTKDLAVVGTGVRLGRRTFANTLKYVRVAASANFGNILSMVIAAATLPFLPMLPSQILLLNFLSDVPNTLVSRDRVDPERVAVAGVWDMRRITRIMIVLGLTSTIFDLLTFALMRWVFDADADTFRTGWFVASALTEFIAMMTLRTSRPAWRSRPDPVFFWVGVLVSGAAIALTYSPLGALVAFVPLTPPLLATLVGITLVYGLANEAVKRVVKF